MNEIDYREPEPLHRREAPAWSVRTVVALLFAGCVLFGYSVGYWRGFDDGLKYTAESAKAATDNLREMMFKLNPKPAATARAE